MSVNTDQQPAGPIVFETQVSAARDANERSRGHLGSLVYEAEVRRDRIRDLLAESGIKLQSVNDTPSDLSYETGRFVVLGKRTSLEELMSGIHESAPNISIVSKTSLVETLSHGGTSFVLKRPLADSRGVNKYLINRPDQVTKLNDYVSKYGGFLADQWYTEPYIKTPGGVNSSYRVVVTSTGEVIASALLYQPRVAGKKAEAVFEDRHRPADGVFSDYTHRSNADGWVSFADRQSQWFLDADAVTSNVSTGGSIIPLKIKGQLGTKTNPTKEQRKILKSHNVKDQETPADLLEAAQSIGRGLGPKLALLIGIDFIQDEQGNHHLLEVNPYPGTDSILTWWGIDSSKSAGDRHRQDRISDDLIRVVGASLRDMKSSDT